MSHPSRPPSHTCSSLHIPAASPSWRLLFQSGADVCCTVGIPLEQLLRDGLGLTAEQLASVDVLLLDGMPVDAPEQAVVPDSARLALASGLPGIAGLAMKQGSAVGALPGGITHTGGHAVAPAPGGVRLFLYSLVLPLLAGHFLQRGVVARASQIERYSRFAPEDLCLLDYRPMRARELTAALSALSSTQVFLTASLTADHA